MQLQTIPRTYVRTSLQISRIPLRIAERATGNEGNEQWAPVLAYDAFQANVKQVLGSLLSDAELVRQGELEQARVATLREALTLEAVAAQTKDGADRTFQDRQAAAARDRSAVQERADRREQDAETERSEAKQKAAADARSREERANRQEQKRKNDLAKAERAAKASEIANERKALAASKRATATKARAIETDKKLRATKARRKAS